MFMEKGSKKSKQTTATPHPSSSPLLTTPHPSSPQEQLLDLPLHLLHPAGLHLGRLEVGEWAQVGHLVTPGLVIWISVNLYFLKVFILFQI